MLHRNGNGNDGIVIAGGGLAGQRCAEALRRHGYTGRLRMVCAERHPPYDRPPLSKELLRSPLERTWTGFRPSSWYELHSVDLLLDVRAAALDPHTRRLQLSDGSTLGCEQMLIATGSRPRTLPMLASFGNVTTLRSIEDCLRLRGVIATRARLAVIGAGFIGQEVAATARGCGCSVTMIETAPTPLVRILGAQMGTWFARLHRAHGVCVRTGTTIDRVLGSREVRELRLSDGSALPVDHIVAGVGVEADVAWLRSSGLASASGAVVVDADGRTAAPGVWAAGDAAASFDRMVGRHVPGAHWEAAARQGARAARAMLGLDPGASPISSFWTDQYGIRIQYVGNASIADALEVEGDVTAPSFTATYKRAGQPIAALLVNRPRGLPAARAAVEKGMT